MNLQLMLKQHKLAIDANLVLFFSQKLCEFSEQDPKSLEFIKYCRDFILQGGKRFRSFLAHLVYEGFGGKKNIYDILVSLELFHSYLLIHDDIIDQDTTRHHAPTVWSRYYNETLRKFSLSPSTRLHLSYSFALVAGDLLNALIPEPILLSTFSDSKKLTLMKLLWISQHDTASGQILDIYSSFTFPSVEQVLETYRLKTSIYSIALPLQFGAILSDRSSEKILDQLENFAEPLGIAYQLSDDILAILGDPTITGKSNSSDLIQKKKTFLIMQTLALLTEKDKKNFLRIFSKPTLTKREIEILRTYIISSEALVFVKKHIATLIQQSRDMLKDIPLGEKEKKALEAFMDYVEKRDK